MEVVISLTMEDATSCRICFEKFTLTDRRPRSLYCGHCFCTHCCTELVRKTTVECPICKKRPKISINNVNDIPIAFQIEDILHALNEPEHHKDKNSGKDICEDHGIENFFFCESHSRFICHSCCIIDHNKDKCKIVKKNEGFIKTVDKCYAELDSEKKEFDRLKSRLLSYITVIKKEEEEHINIQRRLTKLVLKHVEQKTNLENERKKVEQFLAEQKVNIHLMNSFKKNVPVTSMKKVTELTDAIENIKIITRNKSLAEEERCNNFKQFEASIQARKSTQQELMTLTDTNEVETLISKLKTQRESNVAQQPQRPTETWEESISPAPATRVFDVVAPHEIICVEPESHFFYEVQTLLLASVNNHILENQKEINFRNEGRILDLLLENEIQRIRTFAEANFNDSHNSPGIVDFGVYLLSNDVPIDPFVNIYGSEVVWQVCQNATQKTPLINRLSIEVIQRLAEQKEKIVGTNVVEEYNNWLTSYRNFLDCAWYLVYCRQQFEKNYLYLALSLILKACSIHHSLANSHPQGPRKTLDGNVLWKFRRVCLLCLNEQIYNNFKNGEGQETVVELNSHIVPALAQISTSHSKEDEDAILKVRNKWCQLLKEPLGSPAKYNICDQIIKVILLNRNYVNTCIDLPINVPRNHNVLALYKRYKDISRVIIGLPEQTNDL